VCRTRLTEGWEHDRHQAIEDAVVIGLHGGEHPVGKVRRIGLRLGRYRPEILACRPEDIPDRAVAVVDAVEHRLGKIHEPPHQIERQVGAGLGNPVDDHRPLQVEVLHEVTALLPVDEGPRGSQGGDALADLGSDGVAAGL
jgi:hypothetical protein